MLYHGEGAGMIEIIEKAREWAMKEIEKYGGSPSKMNFDTSLKKGIELAEKFNADKKIVMLGCILMDIKLAECKNQGIIQEHVAKSVEASEEFLKQFDLDEGTTRKIVACIAEHHGAEKFNCMESEICANADCYRFIYPRNVFNFLADLMLGGKSLQESLEFVEKKLDEKHNILSLDVCKEELEHYYGQFKELLTKARED
jgi:pimeloyl-CoA synthetase